MQALGQEMVNGVQTSVRKRCDVPGPAGGWLGAAAANPFVGLRLSIAWLARRAVKTKLLRRVLGRRSIPMGVSE